MELSLPLLLLLILLYPSLLTRPWKVAGVSSALLEGSSVTIALRQPAAEVDQSGAAPSGEAPSDGPNMVFTYAARPQGFSPRPGG